MSAGKKIITLRKEWDADTSLIIDAKCHDVTPLTINAIFLSNLNQTQLNSIMIIKMYDVIESCSYSDYFYQPLFQRSGIDLDVQYNISRATWIM